MRAYIWRKSVYERKFRCRCGAKLCTDEGRPLERTLVILSNQEDLLCKKCGFNVGRLEEVNEKLFDGNYGMMGEWNQEYKKGLS